MKIRRTRNIFLGFSFFILFHRYLHGSQLNRLDHTHKSVSRYTVLSSFVPWRKRLFFICMTIPLILSVVTFVSRVMFEKIFAAIVQNQKIAYAVQVVVQYVYNV